MRSRRLLPAVALLVISLASVSACAGPTPMPAPTLLNELLPGEPIECVTDIDYVDDSAQVEATAAHAMPEDEFWTYIDSLGGETSKRGFDELSDSLAAAGTETILAFDLRLSLALYSLDSACAAEWYRANDPLQIGFVSDDTFLYARCDTVSAGREVWADAVSSNTLPWGDVDATTGLGEMLLYVGVTAAETAGTPMDDYFDEFFGLTQVSYETGSNPNGWPQATG